MKKFENNEKITFNINQKIDFRKELEKNLNYIKSHSKFKDLEKFQMTNSQLIENMNVILNYLDSNIGIEYIDSENRLYEKEYEVINTGLIFPLGESREELIKSRFNNLYENDSNREELLKKILEIYDNYPENKGLYIHGSYGSGKTYLVSALANEIYLKYKQKTFFINWSNFINTQKQFQRDSYKTFEQVKKTKILIIDDLGSEMVSEYTRDELLFNILQYRMDNNLMTIITSNLNKDLLRAHLEGSKNKIDFVKSSRIIERIERLCDFVEVITKNYRI